MDDLTREQIDILEFFCLKLIPDFKGEEFNMPYLNFVFNDSDIKSIIHYLKSMEVKDNHVYLNIRIGFRNRQVDASVIDEVINILINTKKEYDTSPKEEVIYIRVPNGKEFFTLLSNIKKEFEKNFHFNSFKTTALLRTLWLRMGVSDINNIYAFLERQRLFIKNDYLFNTDETSFHKLGSLDVSYVNHGNEAWFETNRHIRIYIKKKKDNLPKHLDELENEYLYYCLPVIHYGLIKENNIPTCYIYGIQTLNSLNKNSDVKEVFQDLRVHLRNKEVSPDFIIALNFFIELLQEKGITRIKVPLLQVYNYEYHENLGKSYKQFLDKMYTKEERENLEKLHEQGDESRQVREYMDLKNAYKRCYGKEDIISKNKTERLLKTFALVNEHYGNLEFISDPFIEGDTLICNIVKNNIKKL